MGTVVFGQVPYPDASRAIAANNLALIRVYDNVVDGMTVIVASLDGSCSCLPDLDGAVLRARDHPLALAVKGNSCDIARVALKGQERVRVRGLDVVELGRVVARCGEKSLVGRDAEAIHL